MAQKQIRALCALFTRSERYKFILVLIMVTFMGLLEALTVASIMPFLSILGNPEDIQSKPFLSEIYSWFHFTDHKSFMIFLGCSVLALLICNNTYKSLTTWVKYRFVRLRGYTLSKTLFSHYLSKDYIFYLNRNSSDLTKNVLSEVEYIINGIMVPAMEIITHSMVLIFLILLLMFVNLKIVTIFLCIFGFSYFFIYKHLRFKLNKHGEIRVKSNIERYTIASEAFGGIKEAKILGLEPAYVNRFNLPAKMYALKQAYQDVVSLVPKFIMEAVAFGGIILMALYLLVTINDLAESLPVLGVFTFSGYKMLPALQQIFASSTKLKFNFPALNVVLQDMPSPSEPRKATSTLTTPAEVCFSNSISLEHVFYRYPDMHTPVLADISLEIPAGSIVGFVGSTGSGKTTLVDMILGLLPPSSGRILVDNLEICDERVRLWQQNLGYVPQNIYLADDTVAKNIAFGHPEASIDMNKVHNAAKLARIYDFISNELPQGFDTIVGERGIRLSGGQKQRIGIARALYRDPKVLVLDEATSALDNVTEKSVMDSIQNFSSQKTIIIIAHRLSTVKDCDRVYMLENGQILAYGTYTELLSKSRVFHAMATTTESLRLVTRKTVAEKCHDV